MTRYVWRNGRFVNRQTDEPMELPEGNVITLPMVQSDIAAYKSVVSNKWIDGRSDQREDLKRNNCRLADPSEAIGKRSEVGDLNVKRLPDQL